MPIDAPYSNRQPVVLGSLACPYQGKRAVVYLRVSSKRKSQHGEVLSFEQNPEVQAQPLKEMVAARGWVLQHVYSDRASGAKEKRPGLDSLMADARRGKFDAVVVWRFDRFARSVRQLVLSLEEFQGLQIDFVSHQESLDTGTPMGRAMFVVIAAMAQLERDIARERILAGLEHARRNGTKSGRPIGRPKVIFHRDQVAGLRAAGVSWSQIAAKLGTTIASVRRVYQGGSGSTAPLPKPVLEDL